MKIKVSEDILKANDVVARDVRSRLDATRVFAGASSYVYARKISG